MTMKPDVRWDSPEATTAAHEVIAYAQAWADTFGGNGDEPAARTELIRALARLDMANEAADAKARRGD
jgi:hypothetical protein